MTRPFGLSRRELGAWTALVLGLPLLVWALRLSDRQTDPVDVVPPGSHGAEGPQQARLDLNQASVRELQLLPGIGPGRARQIVAHRERYGPFRMVRDLGELPGFSPVLVERIAPMLTVGAAPAGP